MPLDWSCRRAGRFLGGSPKPSEPGTHSTTALAVACRLVLEGGFLPQEIVPRPPFEAHPTRRGAYRLVHVPESGGQGEQTVLGGLKAKDIDVVVFQSHGRPLCRGVDQGHVECLSQPHEPNGRGRGRLHQPAYRLPKLGVRVSPCPAGEPSWTATGKRGALPAGGPAR